MHDGVKWSTVERVYGVLVVSTLLGCVAAGYGLAVVVRRLCRR